MEIQEEKYRGKVISIKHIGNNVFNKSFEVITELRGGRVITGIYKGTKPPKLNSVARFYARVIWNGKQGIIQPRHIYEYWEHKYNPKD